MRLLIAIALASLNSASQQASMPSTPAMPDAPELRRLRSGQVGLLLAMQCPNPGDGITGHENLVYTQVQWAAW